MAVHVDDILVSPRVEAAGIVFREKRKLGGEVAAIIGLASDGVAGEHDVGHGWVEEGAFDGGACADGHFAAFDWIAGGGE